MQMLMREQIDVRDDTTRRVFSRALRTVAHASVFSTHFARVLLRAGEYRRFRRQ